MLFSDVPFLLPLLLLIPSIPDNRRFTGNLLFGEEVGETRGLFLFLATAEVAENNQ